MPGDDITLTCESAGGLPPATLQWADGDTVINSGPGLELGPDDNGRGGRTLEHTFQVEEEHIRKVFTCTAINTAIQLKEGGPRRCRSEVLSAQPSKNCHIPHCNNYGTGSILRYR